MNKENKVKNIISQKTKESKRNDASNQKLIKQSSNIKKM